MRCANYFVLINSPLQRLLLNVETNNEQKSQVAQVKMVLRELIDTKSQ